MLFIISQISGVIALILVCIGYFVKRKSKFLIFQIVANLFYATSFLLLNAYAAGIITLISTLRCVCFYSFDKYNLSYKKTIFIIPLIFTAYITIGVVFWNSWLDIIPIISASMFTLAYFVKNLKIVRYLSLPPNIMLVVFSFFTTAYSNALLDLIECIVLIVAIIKFHDFKKKKQKE